MNATKLFFACCVTSCCLALPANACEEEKTKATTVAEHTECETSSCEGETTAVAVAEKSECATSSCETETTAVVAVAEKSECAASSCESETTAVVAVAEKSECAASSCESETTAVVAVAEKSECATSSCESETTAVAMNVGDSSECSACGTKSALKPVNDKCPGMGGEIDASVTSIYNGFTIGYCCEGCIEGFEESPVAMKNAFVMQHAKLVNSSCPTSGNEINPEVVSLHNGFAVGFCCENCQAKFNESDDSAKATTIAKFAKPINTECPISTEPTEGKLLVAYRGNVIDFCCKDCVDTFAEADDATKTEILLETAGLTMNEESGALECSGCEGKETAAL
ncbi:MAG: hypothetical protein ACF8GE_07240 [Phycisphaerales bacterium JB043]